MRVVVVRAIEREKQGEIERGQWYETVRTGIERERDGLMCAMMVLAAEREKQRGKERGQWSETVRTEIERKRES